MRYVWAVFCLGVALVAAGCVGASGSARPSRLLPWNWFSADGVARLEAAEGRVAAAQENLVREAQADVRASGLALALVPEGEQSRPVAVAREFNVRADAGLAQAVGAVSGADDVRLRELVAKLADEVEAVRAAGERELRARDRRAQDLSEELAGARTAVAAATERLKLSDLKYQAQAARYRRLVFWVVAAAVVWILLQLLAGAAKFAPGLGPVSRLAGLLSAPVSQALANRGLGAVGRALAGVEQLSASAASFARQQLDSQTDADEQGQIRAAYERAQRGF